MVNKRVSLFLFFIVLFVSGCATLPRQNSIMPEGIYHIIGRGETIFKIAKAYNVDVNEIMRLNRIADLTQINVGQQLFIPRAKIPLPVEPARIISQKMVEGLVGHKYYFSRWRYITLHHSATFVGNAKSFDRNHRSRGIGRLFYHFVIGNGTRSGDGEIEVGWRWKNQKEAKRPFDIQICLVGNFNKEMVSNAQFEVLVKLINVLREQYGISLRNIRRHKDVVDTSTECPGKNFPFYRLKAELRKEKSL